MRFPDYAVDGVKCPAGSGAPRRALALAVVWIARTGQRFADSGGRVARVGARYGPNLRREYGMGWPAHFFLSTAESGGSGWFSVRDRVA